MLADEQALEPEMAAELAGLRGSRRSRRSWPERLADRWLNPVLARELSERVRRPRTALLVSAFLAVLTGVVWLVRAGTESSGWAGLPTEAAGIGDRVFDWTLFGMLGAVILLVPAYTAGAVAGERERQTLVALQLTLLRPRSILLGKLGAAMALLVLLLVASLPILAVPILLGGVTAREVLVGLAGVVAAGTAIACLCLAVSAFVRRVQTATVLAYLCTFALAFGPLALFGTVIAIDESRGSDRADPTPAILAPSPFVAVGALVAERSDRADGDSAFDAIVEQLYRHDGFGQFEPVGPGVFDGVDVEARRETSAWWIPSFGILGGLAVVSLAAASFRLRTPAKVER